MPHGKKKRKFEEKWTLNYNETNLKNVAEVVFVVKLIDINAWIEEKA